MGLLAAFPEFGDGGRKYLESAVRSRDRPAERGFVPLTV
jgi:hypothetical protein